VGAGGGFVLAPVLLLLFPNRAPETISSMSLFVVCINAISGTAAYSRQKWIDFRSGAWFAVATLPGAIAGAFVVSEIPRRAFDAIFAACLIALATWLLWKRGTPAIRQPLRGRGVARRELRDRDGVRYFYAFQMWKGVAFSAGIGFLSSLLGIGGGVIHVPVMAMILRFPIQVAAATSQFVLMFMAGEGTAVHFAQGTLGWDRTLLQASFIALGAVPGAQAGALLSRRLKGSIILRALSIALLVIGARLAVQAVLA
jgi:uncharacterized membrane protein YfcA